MITTTIERSFFNKETFESFKEYCQNELKNRQIITLLDGQQVDTNVSILQKNTGRITMHLNLHKIPESVYHWVFWYANNINENMVPNTFMFVRYSKKYGIPKLLPHVDNSNTDFTIDCQIDSTRPWPIVIENEPYTLNNNDALVFDSCVNTHWREPVLFSDEDYVDMAFFHFIHKDKPNNFKKKASIRGDYIFNYYKKEKELT